MVDLPPLPGPWPDNGPTLELRELVRDFGKYLKRPQMMSWQPMNTARFGERVMAGYWQQRGALGPRWREWIGVVLDGHRVSGRAQKDGNEATHWHPLPSPPAQD